MLQDLQELEVADPARYLTAFITFCDGQPEIPGLKKQYVVARHLTSSSPTSFLLHLHWPIGCFVLCAICNPRNATKRGRKKTEDKQQYDFAELLHSQRLA